MKLIEILHSIKKIALRNPFVKSAHIGDIYSILNPTAEMKYSVVTIDITELNRDEIGATYTVILNYADRTLQDNSNVKEIQSDAFSCLTSLINEISEELEGETDNFTLTTFEQKFNDYCAGASAQFQLTLASEMGDCALEDYEHVEAEIDIDQNGTYDISDYAIANVSVVDESAQKKIKKLEAEIEGLNIEIDNLNASINADRGIVITENAELQTENKLGYNKIIVNVPDTIDNVEWLTQVEYDALSEYDKMTLYNITKNDKVVKQYQGDIMIWEKPKTLYNVWKAGDTIVIDTSNIDWNNKGEQSLQTYLTDPAGRYYLVDGNYIEPHQRTCDDGYIITSKYGLYENRSNLAFVIEEPQPGDFGAAIYQLYDINNDSNRVNNIEVHPEGRYGTWERKSIENDLIKLTAEAVPGGSSRLPILTITFKTDVYEIVDEKPTYTAEIFTHSPWAGQIAEYNYSTIEFD